MSSYCAARRDRGMEGLGGSGAIPVAGYVRTLNFISVDRPKVPSALYALCVRRNASCISVSIIPGMPWIAARISTWVCGK